MNSDIFPEHERMTFPESDEMIVNLHLRRRFFAEDYTIGTLWFDKNWFSDTLEDKTRDYNKDGDLDDDGEDKVYGQTAIPYGRYRISIVLWKKKNRYVPYLHNVTAFSGILIHAGNTAKDTLGCILVGENKVKGGLVNSRQYESRLTVTIQHYISRGYKVYINIV